MDEAASSVLPEVAADLAGDVLALVGDVRDVDALERAARHATELGGLDVAVNNVGGLVGTEPAPSLEVDEDSWRCRRRLQSPPDVPRLPGVRA